MSLFQSAYGLNQQNSYNYLGIRFWSLSSIVHAFAMITQSHIILPSD
jgi:hypothetical protein